MGYTLEQWGEWNNQWGETEWQDWGHRSRLHQHLRAPGAQQTQHHVAGHLCVLEFQTHLSVGTRLDWGMAQRFALALCPYSSAHFCPFRTSIVVTSQ